MDEQDTNIIEAVSESGPNPHTALGRYLRSIREAKYKTQLDFAAQSGLDNNQISKIERGQDVLLSTLVRYARALGYRSLIELFRAPADPPLRKLLRLSEGMSRHILRRVRLCWAGVRAANKRAAAARRCMGIFIELHTARRRGERRTDRAKRTIAQSSALTYRQFCRLRNRDNCHLLYA
jgi:transcriptional regulator with XRE-family HTH domain